MSRYPANIITKSPATPTGPNPITGRAPGVWRMEDVAYWLKQGVWPDASADGYWPYTSLLLSSTSLSNANNNLFVDSSGAFNPISRNGNTTQGSFTPYSTNWSNYFDGSGDYLNAGSNAAFAFGTGDFTVEFWFNTPTYRTSGGYFTCFLALGNYTNSPYFRINQDGRLTAGITASYEYYTTSTVQLNTWTHFAVTRSGSTIRLFVNGVLENTQTNSISLSNSLDTYVGTSSWLPSNETFTGYLSNVRVVKGTAVYTANFTPPAAPLTAISGTSLLTCQSNRFIDNSSNAFTITVNGDTKVQKFSPFSSSTYTGISYNQSDITNWSGYFDGSGDYLTTPTLATIGSGDFSQEAWVFASSTSGTPLIWDAGVGAGTFLLINGTTSILGGINGTTALTATYTLPTNQWTHLVYCRSGTTLSIYANGTRIATGTVSTSAASASYNIGAAKDVTRFFTGYISNLRFVTGSSAYDATQATITVPTTSLTAISGTSLLTCQNAAFTDNSTNNFVITPNGNTTVTGNSPFNTTGYWSTYFNGSSSYLSVPVSSSAFTLPGDFTLEAWVYRAASGYVTIFDTRSGGNYTDWVVSVNSSGQYDFVTVGGPGVRITTTETVPANTWTHTACVRQGSTVKVYLNGVASANTATYSSTITPATTVAWIGTSKDPVSSTGYVSSLRLVKGTAVYTSNFTPPTAPLTAISGTSLLICQNGQFIDNSSNAFTVTPNNSPQVQSFNPFYTSTVASNGGSMYFDGSGDYLFLPSSPNFTFGTGNFTIEFWLYLNSVSGIQIIYDNRPSAGNYPVIYMNGSTLIYYTNSADRITSSALLTATWYHVAVSRSGTSTKMFVNGTQAGSTFTDSTNYLQAALRIGADYIPSNYLNGYINGLRVTNGTALYTAAFTPPTAPVTPTAATTLLLNGMNAGIYDATAINDMETVGNAQVSTVQSKFGGSSMYFDGTGDYLSTPDSPNFDFGAGNFTIEAWVSFAVSTSGADYPIVVQGTNAFTSNASFAFTRHNSNKLRFIFTDDGTGGSGYKIVDSTNNFLPSVGVWYHLAVTRSGSTFRLFIDGVQAGSNTYSQAIYNGTRPITIGADDGASAALNGYIDDLRITKGVARYTANFTPPTQAFPVY